MRQHEGEASMISVDYFHLAGNPPGAAEAVTGGASIYRMCADARPSYRAAYDIASILALSMVTEPYAQVRKRED